MTIIVFLIDTSPSMLQRTYLGTTYLDYARLAVEQFLKQRQRDPASNGDKYMLITSEGYPHNIKSGWKESPRIFNEQLKSLKAKGSVNFESSLESVIKLLTINRMQSGSGALIETYGYGRFPSYAEHVVIIPIVDGSSLPPPNPEARIPKPPLLIGNDLSVDAFRWDQRLYPIVLRLPGHLQLALLQQQGIIPQQDKSIAQTFANQMGGRSFCINSHRSLVHTIDQIIQRIQTNGVLVRFQKIGTGPSSPRATDQENDDLSWQNSLALLKKIGLGQTHSCWQLPEAYWPDSVKNSLPQRTAHPVISFKCENVEPLYNNELQLDKYELEANSPLAQHILGRKEPNLCWQVFVENSYKQPGIGFPFGYIKISTSSTVTLYIMPYNYPELLALLQMAKDQKLANSVHFQQKFERYLNTVPAYYYSTLRKALNRINKVFIQALDDQNQSKKLYANCYLGALQARIKNQGHQEFEFVCSAVYKSLQDSAIPNASLVVKVSRSRIQLGKNALTDCILRPEMASYKSSIPADIFKDSSIFLLETPSHTALPSLQFKNPFDISRPNLCSQLDKMRLNFEQQVQTNNLHVLEGGMPGQKIKLQHAEDLHNLPMNKMGSYEEYMKSMVAIGLGPKKELEPQAARPHAFGNPFKLDKKNMSIVDEVGEVNATATTGNGGNSEGGEKRDKRRERATSEGAVGSRTARMKRKQGPLDPNRIAFWKRHRRSPSICSFDDSASYGSVEIQSAPAEIELLDEMDEEMEEEEQSEIEGGEMTDRSQMAIQNLQLRIYPDDVPPFEEPLSSIFEQNPRENEKIVGGNESQNGLERIIPVREEDETGLFAPSSSSAQQPSIPGPILNATRNSAKKRKRRTSELGISAEQFLLKQRQIRDLIRQFGSRSEDLHDQLMNIISDSPISRGQQRQLLELSQREAESFKRRKLVDTIGKELSRVSVVGAVKNPKLGPNMPEKNNFHRSAIKQNGIGS